MKNLPPISKIILLLFVTFTCTAFTTTPKPWSKEKRPTKSAPISIGSYTSGCVSGAKELPVDGDGYQAMRLSRNRRFGHPSLINFIEKLGAEVGKMEYGQLLVGDLSQPRGGPMPGMHMSHQSGLDADLWYWHPKEAESMSLSNQQRENISHPTMVNEDGTAVDQSIWTSYYEELIKKTASFSEVERVLVHPAIKKELCKYYGGEDWISKIRPWWGHDDHMHVRLKCPDDSAHCVDQEAVPDGNGCDASLDWWFEKDVKVYKDVKPKPAPKKFTLPDACKAVLKGK